MANEYRVNQINTEVWRNYPADARIHHISVEVWRAVAVATATRRRQMVSVIT